MPPLRSQHAPTAQASDAEPIIRLVDLHKSFGPLRVLNGFTLDVPRGKTTVVLGPSGVGKSVVLKHIAGLLRPDSGEVWFHDRRIDRLSGRDLDDARRRMGVLFQLAALFDSETIAGNVAFPLIEHTRLPRKEIRARVSEALATVGLHGVEEKMPAELSGGQKKRVGLARAIIMAPELILYDEPTTGLDPIRSDGINQLINKLRDDLGVSGVAVTHDLASARAIADKTVMILDGRVAAEGTFDDLEKSPDEHVRRFLAGQYDPELDDATPTRSATLAEDAS